MTEAVTHDLNDNTLELTIVPSVEPGMKSKTIFQKSGEASEMQLTS